MRHNNNNKKRAAPQSPYGWNFSGAVDTIRTNFFVCCVRLEIQRKVQLQAIRARQSNRVESETCARSKNTAVHSRPRCKLRPICVCGKVGFFFECLVYLGNEWKSFGRLLPMCHVRLPCVNLDLLIKMCSTLPVHGCPLQIPCAR